MIDTLISSKTRVKLLLKFFLNSSNKAYLRNLEEEFGESTNAIRLELNRFEKAGMLNSSQEGNKKIYRVNTQHPLYDEINGIVRKYLGLDKIVQTVVEKIGDLEQVYLTGTFARGLDGEIIDLVLVGRVNRAFVTDLIEKAERKIHRRIRFITYSPEEFNYEKLRENGSEPLLLWSN